jgi:hypothetical protein
MSNDDWTVKTAIFTSHALCHRYTVDPLSDWKGYVEDRLKRWVLIELLKMDPGVRPQCVAPTVPLSTYNISLSDNFVPPQTWDYADDQIPGWYREWENQKFGRSILRLLIRINPDYEAKSSVNHKVVL